MEDGDNWWEEDDLIAHKGFPVGIEEEQGFHLVGENTEQQLIWESRRVAILDL